jgi:hypothetical protein
MSSAQGNFITYCKNKDIRVRFPSIVDYLDPRWSPQQVEEYINNCRNQAYIWLNNQLESFEIQTYALDNDKRGIEADYSIYLILRGATKRAAQDLLSRFRDDANSALQSIQEKKSSRKNLSTQVSRMTRNRRKFKDYGNLGDQ